MSLEVTHTLLVSGDDLAACSEKVKIFFRKTALVRYDHIQIDAESSCSALSEQFSVLLDRALTANHTQVNRFLGELEELGYDKLSDLLEMPQGYESKLLHLITHLVDGFFGVDAAFYDLDEMACSLTTRRKNQLHTRPERCWLVTIYASTGEIEDLGRLKKISLKTSGEPTL